MGQSQDEITQNLAEQMCWEVARRLYRKQVVDGAYRLDAGAVLDDFFHFLREVGVMPLLQDVDGTAIHREMVPCVQDCPALRAEDVVWHGEHQCAADLAVQR